MSNFKDLNLSLEIIDGLTKMGIEEPTTIQEKAIPLILEGENVICQSETGTGKTLAYLLPIIEKIDRDKRETQAIILAPTHELAAQINNVIVELRNNSEVKVTSTTIVGSGNIKRQMEKLKEKPQIIVGSSGRVLELIGKKKISAHTVKVLVLDEGDKLLHFKNIEEVNAIKKALMRDTQKILVSATLTEKTLEVAEKVIDNPKQVEVKERNKVNEDIIHNYFVVERRDKLEELRKLVHALEGKKILVFLNGSYDVNIALERLRYTKINVEALMGEVSKERRKKALEDFRRGKLNVLIASDLAARGLDIQDLDYIINLDVPVDPKSYLHRSGRVGRAGKKGTSYLIVTEGEEDLVKTYEHRLNITVEKKFVYEGNIVDKIIRKPSVKKKKKEDKYKDKSKKQKTFRKN